MVLVSNNSGFLVSLTPLVAGAQRPLPGCSNTDWKTSHGNWKMPSMSGGHFGFSLYAMKANCKTSPLEGSGSGLMAVPLGKGIIAVNEKGGSDRNWGSVPWPQWLFGYFHVTAVDDLSKAGCVHVSGRGKSLFLLNPELHPAFLRNPLFACLAFSYLPAITSVTTSQVAVQNAV